MSLRYKQAENFEEIKDTFMPGDYDRYKNAYQQITGKATTLTDDDLVNMVAYALDDKDDADWVKDMQAMEAGTFAPQQVDAE